MKTIKQEKKHLSGKLLIMSQILVKEDCMLLHSLTWNLFYL